MSKVTKNPQHLRSLWTEHQRKQTAKGEVMEAVQDIFDSVELVDSVAFVKEQLGEQHGIEIDYHRLKKIMKEELDLRYKKISPISWQGNSDRNKILRQQFAQTLLEVDISKKTIINIDESWLGKSDFRRFSWSLRGVTNSVP
jgi:hypothetical protein